MRLRKVGLQRDRPRGHVDCVRRAAEGAIDRSQIGQRFDVIGPQGDRALNAIGRRCVIAAVVRDQSEMMQAERMIGLGGEHGRINLFGRAVAPSAKIFERQRQ